MTEYERPYEPTAHLSDRVKYANFWNNYFSGNEPTPDPTPSSNVVFTYSVKLSDGRILPEIRNDEDYAGIRGK